MERIDDFLSVSAFHGNARARVSGLLDLEAYSFEQPAPGLILTEKRSLIKPRLTLFLDTQIGAHIYAFAQSRVDRGFDPTDGTAEMRFDEYAIRISPWSDGRFTLQVGKFATVVGNWVQRHDSWTNPLITAPLPYENVTGIWDSSAPDSPGTLLYWAKVPVKNQQYSAVDYADKYLRSPVIWGPSYASGASISGCLGKLEYAMELKNAALSSRPEVWDVAERGFEHPAFSARFGFRPNPTWNFGVSASTASYLNAEASPSLPPGKNIGDYREMLLGQDVSFEWHHLQVWAEFYETRFQVAHVGNADTFAYYLEAKYKLTPQLFGALRWNQQLYATIRDDTGDSIPWGNDIWRIDAALGFRFTTHIQLKLQYSLENQRSSTDRYSNSLAGQLTLRF